MNQFEAISVVCVKLGVVEFRIDTYRFCSCSQPRKPVSLELLDSRPILNFESKSQISAAANLVSAQRVSKQ